jgi:hypothetical protein
VKRLLSLVGIAILLIAALSAAYLAIRRASTPLRLLRGAVVVEGNVTEKLVQSQRLSPLPIEVPAYVARYAFPNPQGQMRTGEQIVTRRTFNRLGEQGSPASVWIAPQDTAINAVDPRLVFPSVAGVRMGFAGVCVLIAYGLLLFGVLSGKSTEG